MEEMLLEYGYSPCGSLQEGFFYDFLYLLCKKDGDLAGDGSGLPEQVCDDGHGIGLFETYFGGSWEQDVFWHCSAASDNSLEPEQQFGSSSDYSFDNQPESKADYEWWLHPWPSHAWFECAGDKDCANYGPEYSQSSDEMGLCESFFGLWPGFLRQVCESLVEQ